MTRIYHQTARAEAAERTAERILSEGIDLFGRLHYDDVTLDMIAAGADVTVKTVLRRFGSKGGLIHAISEAVIPLVEAQREAVPEGDIAEAVAQLIDQYEALGDPLMNVLRQESRVPGFGAIAEFGKQTHDKWCQRVFAPWLDKRTGVQRRRLLAQIITASDLYSWYLLRRQRGLSQRQTELAMIEMLVGLLGPEPTATTPIR